MGEFMSAIITLRNVVCQDIITDGHYQLKITDSNLCFMEKWQTRAKQVMREKKITQEKIAEAIGVSQGAVAHWLSGRRPIGLEEINLFADILGVPRVWLQFGVSLTNTHPAPPDARRIPVLNKIPAGGPRQIVDDYLAGSGMEDISTDLELGRHAFALIIDGDSMLPEFKTGDKVIIDPDIKPRPGDFVAAKCNGDEGTFKKFRPRGTDSDGNEVFELTPLNEDYQTIRSDVVCCEIIGTMVEHRRLRK